LKKIIKNEALFALEFLADFDREERYKKLFPSIYRNLISIGFSVLGKSDISLNQIEQLLNVKNDNEEYAGKLFPFTVRIYIFEYIRFSKLDLMFYFFILKVKMFKTRN
jgi:hypothetical protein